MHWILILVICSWDSRVNDLNIMMCEIILLCFVRAPSIDEYTQLVIVKTFSIKPTFYRVSNLFRYFFFAQKGHLLPKTHNSQNRCGLWTIIPLPLAFKNLVGLLLGKINIVFLVTFILVCLLIIVRFINHWD